MCGLMTACHAITTNGTHVKNYMMHEAIIYTMFTKAQTVCLVNTASIRVIINLHVSVAAECLIKKCQSPTLKSQFVIVVNKIVDMYLKN